jgi:hypothetical protein
MPPKASPSPSGAVDAATGPDDGIAAGQSTFPSEVFNGKFLPTIPAVWPYWLIFNSVDIL